MDECYAAEYEAALLKGIAGGDWDNIGYISYACARSADNTGVELSWYPNIFDRHHEVRVHLPSEHFITCTELSQYDEKPRIFVKSQWLEDLHMRTFSVFALIDAIGMKQALANGQVTPEKLDALRQQIDAIAEEHRDILLVSFADSMIFKLNWRVGQFDKPITYNYQPELIFEIMPKIRNAYREIFCLDIYAVVTQGWNEFYKDELAHISGSTNHVSLNSLGLPFAQLSAIESSAKRAAKSGEHPLSELYMDENFFRSLKLDYGFDKASVAKFHYLPPMAEYPCQYVIGSIDNVRKNLRDGEAD